eukprot:gene18769-25303_t
MAPTYACGIHHGFHLCLRDPPWLPPMLAESTMAPTYACGIHHGSHLCLWEPRVPAKQRRARGRGGRQHLAGVTKASASVRVLGSVGVARSGVGGESLADVARSGVGGGSLAGVARSGLGGGSLAQGTAAAGASVRVLDLAGAANSMGESSPRGLRSAERRRRERMAMGASHDYQDLATKLAQSVGTSQVSVRLRI